MASLQTRSTSASDMRAVANMVPSASAYRRAYSPAATRSPACMSMILYPASSSCAASCAKLPPTPRISAPWVSITRSGRACSTVLRAPLSATHSDPSTSIFMHRGEIPFSEQNPSMVTAPTLRAAESGRTLRISGLAVEAVLENPGTA